MSEEELNEAMEYNLDYTEAMLSDELFGGNEVAEVKLLASEKTIKDLQQKVEQLEEKRKQNIKYKNVIDKIKEILKEPDKDGFDEDGYDDSYYDMIYTERIKELLEEVE